MRGRISILLLAGVAIGFGAVRAGQDRSAAAPVSAPTSERLVGVRLSAVANDRLDLHHPAAIVALDPGNWRSCEDLGRQLRLLERHAKANGVSVRYVAAADQVVALRKQLFREALDTAWLRAFEPADLFAGSPSFVTPTAVRTDDRGQVLTAVSHPGSVPNVRLRSFVTELGF